MSGTKDYQRDLDRLAAMPDLEGVGRFILYPPGTVSQDYWVVRHDRRWVRALFKDYETAIVVSSMESKTYFSGIMDSVESLGEPVTWDGLKAILREHA